MLSITTCRLTFNKNVLHFSLTPSHLQDLWGSIAKSMGILADTLKIEDRIQPKSWKGGGGVFWSVGHTKAISSYWRFSSKKTNLILIIAGFNLEPNHSPFGEARNEKKAKPYSKPVIGFRDKKKSKGYIGHTKAISSYWRFSPKETNLILIIAGFNLEPNHSPFGETGKEKEKKAEPYSKPIAFRDKKKSKGVCAGSIHYE
ncbi:hypothetical protein CDAR_267431 [Caerostris darwini]|uniref:Uncharacterized protein n=1 Tax=Caerostris darwini TaxID=1538125 RepID=A0AAV4TIW9_9ARAC|nr:hypothetical protein CDAR_267431 [Caerostris darwini]